MARGDPRHLTQLQRQAATRQPYDRVLIVCEDAQGAPSYFRELIDHYRLSSANVEIVGSGADPSYLVREAKKMQAKERRKKDPYDVVYCVYDRDQHAHFNKATDEALAVGLRVARSWPCFEFWLVLHFTYHRRPYGQSHKRTAAQNCVKELRQYLVDYRKGASGVFHSLQSSLEQGKRNAARALKDARATEAYNPSTAVHQLVSYLQRVKC